MKISLNGTSLSISFIFLFTFLSGACSAGSLIFQDGFDSYDSGIFPSSGGWNLKYDGYGTSYQVVDSTQSVSVPNSLKLEGRYNWSACADHPLTETPDEVTFEVDVNVLQPGSTDGGVNSYVSLVDPDVEWGRKYGLVGFGADMLVFPGEVPYNLNQWYHVKVKIDMAGRVYDVWLDEILIGENVPLPADGTYKCVRLSGDNSGHTRVLFDNVRIEDETDTVGQNGKVAVYSTFMSIDDTSPTKTGLSHFSDAMKADGYSVEQISRPITTEKLADYDVLIIISPNEAFSEEEKLAIQNFVVTLDRGLFLAGGSIGVVNEITHLFDDLSLGGSSDDWYGQYIVCDATDNEGEADWIKIQSFSSHPITENVNQIVMYNGGYIPAANSPGGVIGIGYSDDDSWLDVDKDKVYDSGETMGSEPVLAYFSLEKIVIVPDSNAFDNMDLDEDGVSNFEEYDNDVLALNIVRWLAKGAPDGSENIPLPASDFTADPTSGHIPLTVQFTDLSTGNPTSWAWDFDSDGTVDSDEKNPAYIYEKAGSYSVSLTVSNEKGSSSEVKSSYIEVNETEDAEEIKNIIETLEADERCTIFVSNLNAANLSATLGNKGPFTVFAPTDDAYAALPEGTLEALMNDTGKLTDVLLHHLVDGKLMASDLVNSGSISSLQGSDLSINVTTDGRVFVRDSEIIVEDIEVSNGVIHVIDSVLPPPESEETPDSPVPELPDLMIQSVSLDNSLPVIGDTITFEVCVYNDASVPAGNSVLGFYVDGVEIKSEYIPELEAYSGFIQTFSWVTERVGDVRVSFVSHADFEVKEREDQANKKTINISIDSPDSPSEPSPAVAEFTSDISKGRAPLRVHFTDLSSGAAAWNWDFGDGSTSTERNPVHTYEVEGNYKVILTVQDQYGTESVSESKYIVVSSESGSDTPEDDSSSGSGGGGGSSDENSGGSSSGSSGGGGGAGSPEPASNIEEKELSQEFITNGNHVKFEFPQKVTCITHVEFDPKRSLGKVTTIVEMLKSQSKIVPTPPPHTVYRHANIWVGNEGMTDPKNIENALVGFKIDNYWIKDNNIDESTITLYRYVDGSWDKLPSRVINRDSNYLYFESDTDEFGNFVIIGDSKSSAIETVNSPDIGNSNQSNGSVAQVNHDFGGDQSFFDLMYPYGYILTLFCISVPLIYLRKRRSSETIVYDDETKIY